MTGVVSGLSALADGSQPQSRLDARQFGVVQFTSGGRDECSLVTICQSGTEAGIDWEKGAESKLQSMGS